MKITSTLASRGGRFALLAAVLLSLAQAASAITWIDEDYGDPLKFLTSSSPSYSSTFNILYDGYNPATMLVTSAVVSFGFADDSFDTYEYVNVYLDGNLFIAGQEVDGTHQTIPTSYDWYHGSISGTLLAGLQDGVINYTVTVTSGDTYLKRAKLVAQGIYQPSRSVPDGGATALLLGFGLAGLVALRRRSSRA
jgi:VPDSG-CTERM motif